MRTIEAIIDEIGIELHPNNIVDLALVDVFEHYQKIVAES